MKVEERKFSCLTSPYDVRDYKIAGASTEEFPEEFSLDGVTVKDQGSVGSCVAHACSSVVEYHNKKQQSNQTVFSTEFIYGYRPFGYYVGEGMYLRQALKTLQKCGDVPLEDLKGNNECDVAMQNVENNIDTLKEKAYPHRISSYVRLNTNDDIKSALMKYGYVVVSMTWHTNYRLKNGIYTYTDDETRGGHAVVIYGWNKDGWLVHNSWGKRWGRDGKFIIPFDFSFNEMWAVVDNIVDDGSIVKPTEKNVFIRIFSKVINFIVNLFKNG
jgi:C1A family cysteine protease